MTVRILERQPIKFIVYAAILIGVVAAFMGSGVMNSLDQVILLENTHPGYMSIIDTAMMRHIPYHYYLNGMTNQIVNGLARYESDNGYTITSNTDGSLTYVGTNNSDEPEYITFTNYDWSLNGGNYLLTDRKEYNLSGAPLSTEEFKVCVFVRHYHVGGDTEYTLVADASDIENRTFSTVYSDLNDYYVQLIIAPGYSSEGITIYPMLTTLEERSEDYCPALLTNIETYDLADEHMTTYTRMAADKGDYLALSDEDHELLWRYIRHQAPANGVWTTIDFLDGTGIYFPENDPDQLQYGQIDAIGQMTLMYGDEGFIIESELRLQETTDLVDYLRLLNNTDYTILIAVRDDGVNALTDEMMSSLKDLGVETPLTEQPDASQPRTYYGYSYYAVLNPGQTSIEEASGDAALDYTGTTRDSQHTVEIYSCGHDIDDPQALIQIDGAEYSMNRRGMNIVVYDNTSGAVIDYVTFDTNYGLRAYRELQPMNND